MDNVATSDIMDVMTGNIPTQHRGHDVIAHDMDACVDRDGHAWRIRGPDWLLEPLDGPPWEKHFTGKSSAKEALRSRLLDAILVTERLLDDRDRPSSRTYAERLSMAAACGLIISAATLRSDGLVDSGKIRSALGQPDERDDTTSYWSAERVGIWRRYRGPTVCRIPSLATTKLMTSGWTRRMIADLLGAAPIIARNPWHLAGSWVRRWYAPLVRDTMTSRAFSTHADIAGRVDAVIDATESAIGSMDGDAAGAMGRIESRKSAWRRRRGQRDIGRWRTDGDTASWMTGHPRRRG